MVNAIILLDMFAKSMPSAIDESLEELQHFFMPYLAYVDPVQPGIGWLKNGKISDKNPFDIPFG